MRYALVTWEVRDLLLIPSFMFSVRHFSTQRRQDAKTQSFRMYFLAPSRLCAFALKSLNAIRHDELLRFPKKGQMQIDFQLG